MNTSLQRLLLSILFFSCLSVSQAAETNDFAPPTLEPNNVVNIVNSYLIGKGYELKKYDMEGVTFDYLKRVWWVLFNRKELGIGTHFMVKVEDKVNPAIRIEGGA